MHNAHYDKASKKLQIKEVNIKNKKVTKKWKLEVNVLGVGPIGFLKLHMTIGDALGHSINE